MSTVAESRQAPTEVEVRELRTFALESARLKRVAHVERSPNWDVVARFCDSWLAQRDVVDAMDMALRFACGELAGEEIGLDRAQAFLDRFMLLGNEDVAERRAAVVSGTPKGDAQ
jgi:beta-lactamase class D